MNSRLILIQGEDKEFLETALKQGWLTGQVRTSCDRVVAENAALRRENNILKGRLAEQREVNRTYRENHLKLLRYKYDLERGYRLKRPFRLQVWFAVISITIALCALGFSLIIVYV